MSYGKYMSGEVVKRESATIYDVGWVGQKRVRVPRTIDFCWLRSVTAQPTLSHKGIEIKELSGWCSLYSAVEYAGRVAERYRIEPEDSLSISIILEFTDEPVIEHKPATAKTRGQYSYVAPYGGDPVEWEGGAPIGSVEHPPTTITDWRGMSREDCIARVNKISSGIAPPNLPS